VITPQPHWYRAKCYTRQQVLDLLHLKRRTFERLHAAGQLPYVQELQPGLPNHKLYRADLLDQYLAGEWGAPVRSAEEATP
jgi:hypothetical protein